MKTRLTELLGIEYPVIQGAMLWLSVSGLASAVSNAGGLGMISAHNFSSADEFREDIRRMKSLTDKPFAVNFTFMPSRRAINFDICIDAALEEGVRIVETTGRSPEQYMSWFKSAGATVLQKVATVRHAQKAEQLGADAVTVFSNEAGGHIGIADVGTMPLIPAAVRNVKIPVIAAGGIASGRGLAAALALGAEGVLMGTRFMASREAALHPNFKELLVKASENDTLLISRSIESVSRMLKTDFSLRLKEIDDRGATIDEMFAYMNGDRMKQAFQSGDINDTYLNCGEGVGLIDSVPTVKEIIEGMIAEANDVIRSLGKITG